MSKKISIKITDTEALSEALADVNGRAKRFTVGADDIAAIARRADQLLFELGAAKADRLGAIVTYRPAGPWAAAYRYAATATEVQLQMKSSGWHVVSIKSASVHPKQAEKFALQVKPAARAAMIARYSNRFEAIPTVVEVSIAA